MGNPQTYNNIRRIVFSLYHKKGKGYSASKDFLLKKERELTRPSFVGLMAELEFYNRFKSDFKLTVTADVGDHSDFSAQIDKKLFRVDVTTNFDYKSYADFEPFIEEGIEYQIALIDRENFELIELIDINFPLCDNCSQGRLFDLALLGNENIGHSENRTWNYDQVHFQYCNNCFQAYEVSRISTFQLPDVPTLQGEISEYAEMQSGYDRQIYESIFSQEYNKRLKNINRYLKGQFEKIPFGLVSNSYTIINPKDAEGYWESKVYWQENFLKGLIPEEFGQVVIE